MTRWVWTLRRGWLALSPAQLILAGLVLLAVLLQCLVIQPLDARIASSESARQQAQQQQDALLDQHREHTTRARTAQADLLSLLPDSHQLEASLQQPERIARRHRLAWQRTEYQTTETDPAIPGVEHVVMRCSLQGDYPALRRFLADLLGDMPHVAVDTLAFTGATPQTPASLDLTLSIFLQATPGGQALAQGGGTP